MPKHSLSLTRLVVGGVLLLGAAAPGLAQPNRVVTAQGSAPAPAPAPAV